MPETLNRDEVRQLIESDPAAAIEILSTHPAATNRMHPHKRTWKYCWDIAHGIAPEQRKEAKDAQIAENVLPDEVQTRIDEIMADSAWTNRLDRRHKPLHQEYMRLITQKGQENNGR